MSSTLDIRMAATKVISFSLWGNNPTYLVGALRNADIAREVYPEFECWFYVHSPSVPAETINELRERANVRVFLKDGDLSTSRPMTWRFEAIDDPTVEIMMSRDTDTRILPREVSAVREWLASGKTFHIMRDHPHHRFPILGGMFGTHKIRSVPVWIPAINEIVQRSPRNYDQDFLRDCIYPHIKNDAVIHTSFLKYHGEEVRPFPIPYGEHLEFVGEYVYADDSRSAEHVRALAIALASR